MSMFHSFRGETIWVEAQWIAKFSSPVFRVRMQCTSHQVDPLPLIDSMASQQGIMRHISGDESHRAVQSQGFTETLLHELQAGHVICRNFTSTLQDLSDFFQCPGFIVWMFSQQLQGEAKGRCCGFMPCNHQIHHMAIESTITHPLAISTGIIQHGSYDGVLTQFTSAGGFNQVFNLLLHLLFGCLVPLLKLTFSIKEGQEALQAILRLCGDASHRHPQTESEGLHELVRCLFGTQALHIAHVQSHAT
mmetsp:Transcript_40147/g.49563  ORF Transcript_40147/g.49563 Transcript_40147/m.49563 type:complete len:248 (-) Transcript_40147:1046-1789(-)